MKNFIVRAIGGVFLVYVILVALMFFFQRSLMYFPQGPIPQEIAKKILPEGQAVSVSTQDGLSLRAYVVAPKDANKPVLIVFHGNGDSALGMAHKFSSAIQKGYGLVLAEYRGYGGNAGQPSEQGLYKDADAYLGYVVTAFPKNRIIIYGQSLGSGVAVDVVSRHPDAIAGLILEVPFDSAVDVAARTYPFIPFCDILVKDKYRSIDKIKTISIPKLFLIAEQDEVVGTQAGLDLYSTAMQPKVLSMFPNAGHMTVYNFGAEGAVQDFIEQLK